MKCMNCGRDLPDGSKFCSFCGQKQEVTRFCSKCGAKIAPGAAFCSGCGARVETDSPVNVPDPAAEEAAAKEAAAEARRAAAAKAQAEARAREEQEAREARERAAARKAAREAKAAAEAEAAAAAAAAASAAEAEAAAKAKAEAEAAAKAKAEAEAAAKAEAEAAARAKAEAKAKAEAERQVPDTRPESKPAAPNGEITFCPQCGKANRMGASRCAHCGFDMEGAQAQARIEAEIAASQKKKIPKIKIKDFNDVKIFLSVALYILVLVISIVVCLGVKAKNTVNKISDKFGSKKKQEKVDKSKDVDKSIEEEAQEETERLLEAEEAEETGEEETQEASAEGNEYQDFIDYLDSVNIGGTINYNDTVYKPADVERVQYSDGYYIEKLVYEGAWGEDEYNSGEVYDASSDKTLQVEAYYDFNTKKPERVVTVQEDDKGTHVYDSYFEDGKLIAVLDCYVTEYDPNYFINGNTIDKSYLLFYANDRLQTLIIKRENGKQDRYEAQGFDTMGDAASLFEAREASYLNRAYLNYDLVN